MFGVFTMLWSIVSVILVVSAILLAAPFMGPHRSFWTIAPYFFRFVAWMTGITWEIQGWEALPEAIRTGMQPVIFMGNHESQLDPPFLVTAIPIPAVYIAKKEVKYIPMVGWAAMCAGVIFIDRGARERAVKSLHHAAEEIRSGKSVTIFAEGTRTRTGDLLPFKKGSFILAQDAGVPIVPFGIHGGFNILRPGAKRIRPGHYLLRFGTPIESTAQASREALMAQVRAQVEQLRTGPHAESTAAKASNS